MTIQKYDTDILIITTAPRHHELGPSEKSFIDALKVFGFKYRILSAVAGLMQPVPESIVVLAGSPYSVLDEPDWLLSYEEFVRDMIRDGKTILGICFGFQLLVKITGGKVSRMKQPQIGKRPVRLTSHGMEHSLLDGLPSEVLFPVNHGDHVEEIGEGTTTLAETEFSPHYAVKINIPGAREILAVQFHPEMRAERLRELILSQRDSLEGWEEALATVDTVNGTDFGTKMIENWGRAVSSSIKNI